MGNSIHNTVCFRGFVNSVPEQLTDRKTGKFEGRYQLNLLLRKEDGSLTPCKFGFLELGKGVLPASELFKGPDAETGAMQKCEMVCKVEARQKAVDGHGDKRSYVGQEWSLSIQSFVFVK